MNAAMATRNHATQSPRADECTEFQLHVSQSSTFDGIRHKVFDYAEFRLYELAANSKSMVRRVFLLDLIERYCSGEVAIAWFSGEPVFITVIQSS